jgi:hypothetical protein
MAFRNIASKFLVTLATLVLVLGVQSHASNRCLDLFKRISPQTESLLTRRTFSPEEWAQAIQYILEPRSFTDLKPVEYIELMFRLRSMSAQVKDLTPDYRDDPPLWSLIAQTKEEALAISERTHSLKAMMVLSGLVVMDRSNSNYALNRFVGDISGYTKYSIVPNLARALESAARGLYSNMTSGYEFTEKFIKDFTPAERKKFLRRVDVFSPEFTALKLDGLTDILLGLNSPLIQQSLIGDMGKNASVVENRYPREQSYTRYHSEAIQTRYADALKLFSEISPKPGQKFVDIGSGYGRVGVVAGLKVPWMKFTGYELIRERVEAAQATVKNLALQSVEYFEQNLSDPEFKIPPADFYYMYEPVSQSTLEKVLGDLKQVAKTQSFTLIATEGHGQFIDFLRQQDWLQLVRSSPESETSRGLFYFEPRKP